MFRAGIKSQVTCTVVKARKIQSKQGKYKESEENIKKGRKI